MTAGPDSLAPRRPAGWPLAACVLLASLSCGDDPTTADPVCGQGPTVTAPDTVNGALTDGDGRLAGAFVDYYSLELDTGAELTLRLSSTDIAPLLLRLSANGNVTQQAFDPTGTPRGEAEVATLAGVFEPGCHLIGASSYLPDSTGTYRLTVTETP